MTSLVSTLKRRAELAPESPCITHLASGKTLTYGDVLAVAERLTGMLAELGVNKKDRVAFVVRNHWLVFPLLVACSARRATLVPVDPELHRDELSFILGDAAPVLTIHLDGATIPKGNGKSVTRTLDQVLSELQTSSSKAELVESAKTDVALMIYTSGTTGTNKCVMLTDGNLVANATALVQRYGVTAQDRFFCMLPTHHMNALMITGMVPIVAGAHIFLSDILSFKNAKHYWKHLSELGITICSVVPSIMALQLKLFPQGPNVPVPQLRFGFCGAAPLAAETWKQFEDTFGIRVYQGYGLTETTCWAVSTPASGERRHDSVGVPLDGVEIRIAAAEIGDVESFDFESKTGTGEVLIKGAIVGPGYYKNAKLTKESMTADGFFRTGDLGYFDADGCLHISGRLKEVIIKNGANVFSKDVDAVLATHPAVESAKTIGVRDELVGERIVSACVLREGHTATEQELRTWAQTRLSHHMWPDSIVQLGYLPAGAAGKVSTNVLRKIVTGELTEEILGSLGSWKHKRAQPSEPEKIRATIQDAVTRGRPIQFLSYWGAGTRDTIGEVDRVALERLAAYVDGARRVAQAKPVITLIFTDMHARNNRIPEARMQAYWAAIRAHAHELGMDTICLSEIWEGARLSASRIAEEVREPGFEQDWLTHPLRTRLVEQAQKHVEQGGDPDMAARFYSLATQREGAAIAERYASSIFLTYNHPDFDCVSPPLPKIYLHSFKEGTSIKPWFVD